jgi:DNA-binding NarL/FixJ family response regulator
VRIALVSNSPLVLAELGSGLRLHGSFEIVVAWEFTRATSGQALALAQAQVCIADLAPDTDVRPILEIADQVAVLILVPADRDDPIADWLAAGFSALPRDASIDSIAAAAQATAAGLVTSTREMSANALRAGLSADQPALAGAAGPLTPREREVLQKMSLGLGNREIAQALHISAHTAKFHVAQIIAKLDANSRAHAVAKALRGGLVEI